MDNPIVDYISLLSALFAAIAAFGWGKSASIETPHPSKGPVSMSGIADALKKQSYWSKVGALSACFAAMAQALAIGYPSIMKVIG